MNVTLNPRLVWAVGGVLGVLITASVSLVVLRIVRPHLDLKSVVDRVKSWWVMAGIFGRR